MNQSPQIAARPSGLPCQIDLLAAAYPSPSRAASFVFARPLGLPSAAFRFRPALPRLYSSCLVLLACLLLPSGSVPRCLVCICSSCLVLLAFLLLPPLLRPVLPLSPVRQSCPFSPILLDFIYFVSFTGLCQPLLLLHVLSVLSRFDASLAVSRLFQCGRVKFVEKANCLICNNMWR